MNPTQLLAHFDRISEAPEAIPRLRRFILDLAVRGKLVEQDPQDEPAVEVLLRIHLEKAAIARQQQISTTSAKSFVCEDDGPFQLPRRWQWTHVDNVFTSVTDGDHLPPPKTSSGIPFLVIGNVHNRTIDFQGCRHVGQDYYDALDPIRQPRLGDVLYTLVGSYGIPVIVTNDRPFCVQRHIGILRPSIHVDIAFLARAMQSQFFFEQATACATGIAQKTVPLGGLRRMLLPLPPLAEQHRIVAKVDELMALCDRLEAAQAESESRRDRLVAASLHRLNNTADPDAFREHARFHLRHLSRLTTRAEQVQQLRQTIVDLAVHGQLLTQRSNDEPGSELLKRIQAEKARLTKQGLLRKEKPLAPVDEDTTPFALPKKWSWSRIGTCSLLTEYGTSVKSDHAQSGVPVLKMGDIQGGRLILGGQKKVPSETEDLPQLFLKRFDLLYNRTNSAELVGKTGIYLGDDDAFTFASYLIRIRFMPDFISPEFANLAMNASYFRETQILPELQQQCGQANVNGTKLRNMLIPIPPIAEQRCIVAKVEELLKLCDRLETQLITAQTERRGFLQAVLHESVSMADIASGD